MEGQDFLELLQNSKCLVGNSSVGIRECSFLGVSVVNIGSRQNRRERANNVIDIDYDFNEIVNAIKMQVVKSKPKSESIYGKGNSGKIVSDLLSEVPLQFHKIINY